VSRHIDDILGIIDRLFGPEDEEPPPRRAWWSPSLTEWYCATDATIVGRPNHELPPRCDDCGELMERYLSRNDPTRADRPNW
jgi:hypothetical protein